MSKRTAEIDAMKVPVEVSPKRNATKHETRQETKQEKQSRLDRHPFDNTDNDADDTEDSLLGVKERVQAMERSTKEAAVRAELAVANRKKRMKNLVWKGWPTPWRKQSNGLSVM